MNEDLSNLCNKNSFSLYRGGDINDPSPEFDMVNKQTNKCFIVNQDAHNEQYNQYNHSIQLIHIISMVCWYTFVVSINK